MALDILTTDLGYWSQGIVRAGRKTGPLDMVNALLDEAGDPFRRSGSVYKSNAAFGSTGLRWIWDGILGGGRRTIFAYPDAFAFLSASDDATPTQGAFASLVYAGAPGAMTFPRPTPSIWPGGAALIDIGGIESSIGATALLYGGSLKTTSVTAGTAAITLGSTAVTGTGTSWTSAAVDPGMLFEVTDPSSQQHVYVVQRRNSNTSVTLTEPAEFTGSGLSYALTPADSVPSGYSGAAELHGVFQRRRLLAIGHELWVSPEGVVYPITSEHEFPSPITGLGYLRDILMVFTDAGVWAVSGLANNLVDDAGNPLRRQELVNEALVLWNPTGLSHWNGALIVPALDGVWLLDSNSAPVKISAGITDLYDSYVQTAGYRPGGATVYRNHYLLPILDGSANVVDVLVCRLIDTRSGRPFVWTRLAGSGANVAAFTTRAATSTAGPLLLGAGRQASSRVLSLPFLEPVAARKQDHDGTAHQLELQTGDLQVSQGRKPSLVKRVAGTYELVDAASDNPTLDLSYQIDGESTWHLLTPTAPEDDGTNPYTWNVGHYAHRIRFRLRTQGPPASMKLRTLEVHVRRTGKT